MIPVNIMKCALTKNFVVRQNDIEITSSFRIIVRSYSHGDFYIVFTETTFIDQRLSLVSL